MVRGENEAESCACSVRHPRPKPLEEWLPVEPGTAAISEPQLPPALEVDELRAKPVVESFGPPARWERVSLRVQIALETPLDRVRVAWARERSAGAFFLWQPVFFGLGCIIYFNLPREPLPWAFPLAALLLVSLAWSIRQGRHIRAALVLAALVAFGASAAQWRVMRVDTQMLSRSIITDLQGIVVNAERRADGRVRYLIEVMSQSSGIKNRVARDFDGLMRVTARKGGPNIGVGEGIAGKVKVAPPSGAAYPGGYSFAFQSWFNGIGASGFFLGKPEATSLPPTSSPRLWIAGLRADISALIRRTLPGRNGGLAAALIVGDRSGIDEETAEALRRSGLAHILAISGLHMALVAATVISGLRWLLALFPDVVQAYPVRKWAAAGALAAATFYLVLSSASVATQRAYIMVAIMLVAVMLDRRALTMRNVAIAAFVVLIMTPEAILMPGFQMSFAAVAALVATYETLSRRSRQSGLNSKMAQYGMVRRFLVRDVGGLALTSLVAGIATGLFAAYHFHRVAPLGLIANLGAMPLVSLVVMPLALVSVLAMPFGLEQYPLALMAYGTEGVVNVAEWVSERGPSGNTGLVPLATILGGAIALLLACLFRTRLRLLSLVALIAAAAGFLSRDQPDVLILENGAQIGLLDGQGALHLMRPKAEKFSTEIWKRAFAPVTGGAKPQPQRPRFNCDDTGCVGTAKGMRIASVQHSASLPTDCLLADILVLRFASPDACSFVDAARRPLVIDQSMLKKRGAYALTIHGGRNLTSGFDGTSGGVLENVSIDTAFGPSPRPWTRHRFK